MRSTVKIFFTQWSVVFSFKYKVLQIEYFIKGTIIKSFVF